jgi:hypothetical protein
MDTGCKMMFKQRNIPELATMYSVFSRVEETLIHIVDKMQPYIEEMGTNIVTKKENLADPLEFTS